MILGGLSAGRDLKIFSFCHGVIRCLVHLSSAFVKMLSGSLFNYLQLLSRSYQVPHSNILSFSHHVLKFLVQLSPSFVKMLSGSLFNYPQLLSRCYQVTCSIIFRFCQDAIRFLVHYLQLLSQC